MRVRYPAPLRPGDTIGVTAPSSGVRPHEQPRFDHCVQDLRERGYDVRVGDCVGEGDGIVSAPASERAAELMAMLLDPAVRAVVPPWGGELAIDLLPLLDLDAVADASPTWVVGYSDTSTVLLPLALVSGLATVHAAGLMETPYAAPAPLLHWLDVVTAPAGSTLQQAASAQYQGTWPDLREHPHGRAWALSEPTRWRRLGSDAPFAARGRLVGGCLETVALLAGSRYGDVPGSAGEDGHVVYLEVAESNALTACRLLHAVRLAGWFDAASVVLLGRTSGPPSGSFTQHDAVVSALGDLPVPVLLDVDLGHVPPQLSLVNGALAEVTWEPGGGTVEQRLV